MFLGSVAIVGRPNVGKSTLFNRLVGFKKAIISDIPGTTRDRLCGEVHWLENNFFIIDTGGIENDNIPFQKQIRRQVKIAIDEADIILFVVDGKEGITSEDKKIIKMIFKSNKEIFLIVNKIDNVNEMGNINDFYSLGITPMAISSIHGIGMGDLLEKIINSLKKKNKKINFDNNAIRLSIIGRQNVGKSTLLNTLTGKENVIVSDIPGTTRDAVDTMFTFNNKKYIVIDTAGLKKRGKISEKLDKFSSFKTFQAIARSEIVLLVLDISEGIVEQDKHIAGYAVENPKAVIIIVNKCDIKKDVDLNSFSNEIRLKFKFLHFANIVFISALKKNNINKIFNEIDIAYKNFHKKIDQKDLNEIIDNISKYNEPPSFHGGRIKIFSIKQINSSPIFNLYVNNFNFMHFSYMRYIENGIRKSFSFDNVMIKIFLKNGKSEKNIENIKV